MRNYLLIALAACGTSPAPSTSGLPFTVADTAAMVRTNRRLVNIELTSFADTCSIADERMHPGSQDFRLMLADLDADAAPTAPGTFPVYTLETLPTKGLAAECGTISSDATCRTTMTECSSGTITLTRVDAAGFAGTFDVMIDGKHASGSFDAPSCPDVSETGFGSCQ